MITSARRCLTAGTQQPAPIRHASTRRSDTHWRYACVARERRPWTWIRQERVVFEPLRPARERRRWCSVNEEAVMVNFGRMQCVGCCVDPRLSLLTLQLLQCFPGSCGTQRVVCISNCLSRCSYCCSALCMPHKHRKATHCTTWLRMVP